MKNNVILTGAGGFLGREIIRQCVKRRDINIIAITSNPLRLEEYIFENRIKFINPNNYETAFAYKGSILVNCAFPRANDEDMAAGLEYIKNIFECAAKNKIAGVINISSQSVYSQNRVKAAENNEKVVLESKYAVGKYSIELLLSVMFNTIPHTNLRMASLIGPGFDERLINKLINKIINNEDIVVSGLNQRFEFMDVRDAALGIIAMLSADYSKWEDHFNFGVGHSYTLDELMDLCIKEAESRKIAYHVRREESEAFHNNSMNSEHFMKTFNWCPQYSIEKSIKDIFDNISQRTII